jgi:cobalt/nickel transport system permease protein
MHIPDGFLSNRLAASLDLVAAACVIGSAQRSKIDPAGRIVPTMGLMAAFVFAAQMLNFPVLGGTSGHLIGGALLSIILGPMAALLTMTTVIIAQALFLQDGGLVALGANIFNIGAVPVLTGYAFFRLFGGPRSTGRRLLVAGFAAAWMSLLFSAACCALELALSGTVALRIGLPAMVGYHAVIGIAEGGLTAGILSFLARVRPELISAPDRYRFGIADWAGGAVLVAGPVALLALGGASQLPDPLQNLLGEVSGASTGASDPLLSPARYGEYLWRAGAFLAFGVAVCLIMRLARGRSGRA